MRASAVGSLVDLRFGPLSESQSDFGSVEDQTLVLKHCGRTRQVL